MTDFLNLGFDYDTVISLEYKTEITSTLSGKEQRNICWMHPLLKFKIGQRSLSQEELDYFLEFFQNKKGSFKPFLIRDWSDYHLNNIINIGDGATRAFQLYKIYKIDDSEVIRPIYHPRQDLLNLLINGSIASNWQLIQDTGIVVFNEPPPVNAVITAKGDFDVLVRFENDNFEYSLQALDPLTEEVIYNLAQIDLTEVRTSNNRLDLLPIDDLPVPKIPEFSFYDRIKSNLDLGIVYNTTFGISYKTSIISNKSAWEQRDWFKNRALGFLNFATKRLNKVELDYVISLFRLAFGKAISFKIENKNYRFDSDLLSVTFKAYADRDTVIFDLNNLPAIAIKEQDAPNFVFYPLNLPLLRDSDPDWMVYFVAAPGLWNFFDLVSPELGNLGSGFAARGLAIGTSLNALGKANPCLIDRSNYLDVEIEVDGQTLQTIDKRANYSLINLALIGGELISFETVTVLPPNPLGFTRYRLSGLARGVKGTESRILGHFAGEKFFLLSNLQAFLTDSFIDSFVAETEDSFDLKAIVDGFKIDIPSFTYTARSMRPYAPILRSKRIENGDLEIRYEVRSRRANIVEIPDFILITIKTNNQSRAYNLPYISGIKNKQILTLSQLSNLFGFAVTANSQISIA